MDNDTLGGTPKPVDDQDEELIDLDDCLILPHDRLPADGQIVATHVGKKQYALLTVATATSLKNDRSFLHVLRANGLASWSKYKKAVKEYRKQQYGENN